MDELFEELMFFAVGKDSKGALLVNEEVIEDSNADTSEICLSLLTLARAQLMDEVSKLNGTEKITISVDPAHKDLEYCLRFLVNNKNDFRLLTYFGQLSNPNANLKHSLEYITKSLIIIESNF